MQKRSQLLWSCVAGCAALVVVGAAGAAPRSMATEATTARMPTMPTMSINTIGTHAVSGVSTPTPAPTPTPIPTPTPDPTPVPTPVDCPDGGVANSEFTVDACMQSVLDCVQSGVLPNGLNDLFNEDLRNSIINGMGICASQIDYCIRNVRVDCHNVYDSSVDVWLDFNSRIVQPEYYNFVLRRTGLTPNQAENVCELLDKNTYGKSFAAVSASGNVTSEYNDKVGAYNEQDGGVLSKNQPQGPMVNTTNNGNTTGVDGERGHYARWDSTNGVCKVRVAAYNKDNMITNKWLFGAIGDDKAAEVWQDAGSSFTCNKDLFDFSLMNNTKTTAVVGMGGGTLLGAGIGALAGHGARDFDCDNVEARKELYNVLQSEGLVSKLNQYLNPNVIPLELSEFKNENCEKITELYKKMVNVQNAIDVRGENNNTCKISVPGEDVKEIGCDQRNVVVFDIPNRKITIEGKVIEGIDNLSSIKEKYDGCMNKCGQSVTFHSLKGVQNSADIYCSGGVACVEEDVIKSEIKDLKRVFENDKVVAALQGTKSTVGKNALIGAGIGLGTGGVATAITAFVERNNISCRVGDGLDTVGFGKSYTIGSLKDFYVKWNLRVADSISPTARVTSCEDWIATCGMYTTPEDCKAVEINYQRPGRNTTTLVRSACRMSGSVCIENRSVAVSYGACKREPGPILPVGPVFPGTSTPVVIQH